MTNSILRLRTLLLALMLGVAGVSLGACNTMEGMGEDMQSAGGALEEEANEAND